MRGLLLLFVAASFIGCKSTDKENTLAKNRADLLKLSAEQSKERISELPLGFEFGMNQAEIDEKLLTLVAENKLDVRGQYYTYRFPVIDGDTIESHIEFGLHNNELYALQLSIFTYGKNEEAIAKSIASHVNCGIDSLYKTASYYDKFGDEHGKAYTFSYWVKGNQIIFLRNAIGMDLSYTNAPIGKIIRDQYVNEALEKARKRAETGSVQIENSSWDGSVSQVKKYLKQNLSDPESYEGIEWSDVAKTNDGYMVRHKFRAKNGFGGYVVENKVFYLNGSGVVTGVNDYK